MASQIELTRAYRPSNDVVVREIQGKMLILPLATGIGDADDELFTLNSTGKAIWGKLDGTRSLAVVVAELAPDYSAAHGEIERGVLALVGELVARKILVAV